MQPSHVAVDGIDNDVAALKLGIDLKSVRHVVPLFLLSSGDATAD